LVQHHLSFEGLGDIADLFDLEQKAVAHEQGTKAPPDRLHMYTTARRAHLALTQAIEETL
jgi:hypothetical protein